MATRYVIFFAVALLVMGGAHYYVWARLVRDAGLPSPWGASRRPPWRSSSCCS
jgi:hypothetical protein